MAVKLYLITVLKTYDFEVGNHNCEMKLNVLLETTGPVGIEFRRRGSTSHGASEAKRRDSVMLCDTALPSRRFGILTASEI